MRDRAWLIEKSGEHGPEWIMLDDVNMEFVWSRDSVAAQRYRTREFAEEALVSLRERDESDGVLFRKAKDVCVTEHEWVAP